MLQGRRQGTPSTLLPPLSSEPNQPSVGLLYFVVVVAVAVAFVPKYAGASADFVVH